MKPIFSLLAVIFLCNTVSAQQPRWVRTGHLGGVCGLVFTPDGQHFISSATEDGRILVWKTANGNYERTINTPSFSQDYYSAGPRSSLALSPNGSTIASGGERVIYLIDFATGITTDSIVPNTSEVYLLQFSPTGDTVGWITSGYNGGNFYRYSRSTRQFIDSLPVNADGLRIGPFYRPQIAISADLNTVAYVHGEDTTAFVDMREQDSTNLLFTPEVESISLNASGTQLASGGRPSEILNITTGNVLFEWSDTVEVGIPTYIDHSDTILYFGLDTGIWLHIPDSSTDQFIKITSTVKGGGGSASFYGVGEWAFSPNRGSILSVGEATDLAGTPVGSEISIYKKPDFIETEISGSCGAITNLRWSPTADTISASDDGGGLHCYIGQDGVPSLQEGPAGVSIGGFDYFSNGDSIAVSIYDDDDVECGCSYVGVLSCDSLIGRDGIITGNVDDVIPYAVGLMLPHGGTQLVLGNYFVRSFGMWNTPPALVYPDAFAFSPDGSILLIGGPNNLAAQNTNNADWTNLSDPNQSDILGASFAPNGNEIAVWQADQSVEVLGYPACNQIYQLKGHTGTITGAIFSRDSRYLVTSSSDSTMRVWDLSSGKTITTYSYPSPLVTAGFSYDSRYVAATDSGTSVIVWDAPGDLSVQEQQPTPTMSLSQNSPNPVLTTTTFSYSVPFSENVTIGLYDVMGREVSVLTNGRVDAGIHSITFSLGTMGGLATGVYYYRLEAASGVLIERMVVE